MSAPTKIAAIRGMHDILPPQSARWQFVEAVAHRLFQRYGYGEIRTPLLEVTELFVRSIGEVTDIVEKEMYTFADRKGKNLTLRPEGTASTVRAILEAGLLGKDGAEGPVHRFYYLGPMFRYERPQKGRQRQFHQVGAEVYGDASPRLDAEVLAMGAHFLEDLGLASMVRLEVNSLGNPASRGAYLAALKTYFASKVTQLCPDCQRRLERNALRILDCKVEACGALFAAAPKISAHLDEASRAHFAEVLEGLKQLGVAYSLNDRMVRGLDYYTGTTFEFVTEHLGAQGAVLAGGRYDGLVAELGGPPTPAIGFAAGLERLVLLHEQHAPEPSLPGPAVFLIALGRAAQLFCLGLAGRLRRVGLAVGCELRDRSLKAQMRTADRLRAGKVVIVGDQELAAAKVVFKDMATGTQQELLFRDKDGADLAETLRAKLG